jgi:hypothetical protein
MTRRDRNGRKRIYKDLDKTARIMDTRNEGSHEKAG